MNKYNILNELSENNIEEILRNLKDNYIWLFLKYLLDTKVRFPNYTIFDPESYNKNPINDNIFNKIILSIIDKKLSNDQIATVISQLSSKCSKEQWYFYKDILKKNIPNCLTIPLYNKYAPYRIDYIDMRVITNIEEIHDDNIFEPFYDCDLVILKITNKDSISVTGFYKNGNNFTDKKILDSLYVLGLTNLAISDGIIIEGYYDNNILYLRDIITLHQFEFNEKTKPLYERKSVLEKIYNNKLARFGNIELVETYDNKSYIKLISEQGFDAVLIRDKNSSYFENALDMIYYF